MNKVILNDLFTKTDINTGENIYYTDSSLEKPYSGIVVDYFKGVLNWKFEVQDGFMTGIGRVYYEDTGELMEESETDHNTVNGVAKEFFKNGNIKSISILIRNQPIDTIYYDEYRKKYFNRRREKNI
ncbi:hypothetical protein [Clostridium sp. JS66]|uniref:hypothetical protein n=1 Tax=Clostridium sp. JS66 TaxID=3064705 RepID=UPI00298E2985|nr:hypothetical protein [Clostridium sp. JS66]WPC43910.1 hypothetical protein Q6H37_10660 [Clostridium sp. JS66]